MTERSVAVVGAGVSGLACARRLMSEGWQVELFDKGRVPGGRVSSRSGGFDHGAQYFTARDPRFVAEVKAWEQDGIAARWKVRFGSLTRGDVVLEEKGTQRYVGTPGMASIAEALARGLTVRAGVRVEACRREAEQWVIEDDAGAKLGAFDALVLAVPAPQAVALLGAAPALAARLAELSFEPCWAGMLTLARPLEVPLDGIFIQESPLRWAAREASKPGRGPSERWVVHAGDEASRAHLEDSPEQALRFLVEAFREACGSTLEVESGAAHRWRYARPVEETSVGVLWDAALRVGACGDALHGGRVEGAYLSGIELADGMRG